MPEMRCSLEGSGPSRCFSVLLRHPAHWCVLSRIHHTSGEPLGVWCGALTGNVGGVWAPCPEGEGFRVGEWRLVTYTSGGCSVGKGGVKLMELMSCECDLTMELAKRCKLLPAVKKKAVEGGQQESVTPARSRAVALSIQRPSTLAAHITWSVLTSRRGPQGAGPGAVGAGLRAGEAWLVTLYCTDSAYLNASNSGLEWVMVVSGEMMGLTLPWGPIALEPGATYRVDVTTCWVEVGVRVEGEREAQCTMASSVEFRAERTIKELRRLLRAARRMNSFPHITADFLPCRWLHRHKPPQYYRQIEQHHANMMHVYIKDDNGDQASCINGKLNGLFFTANVNFATGEPMWRPIFGAQRLRVSSHKMLELASNIYFADVYCNTTRGVHHVTLVMTRPGSSADRFCASRLVRLSATDRQQNPFLFVSGGGEMCVSTRVMVEVLYTEDVDINRCLADKEYDGFFDWCPYPPQRQRHGGRPKNAWCTECNLA